MGVRGADLHEVRVTMATGIADGGAPLSKKQLQQAQRVVDAAVQRMLLGLSVRTDGQDARLRITTDLRTLELDASDGGTGEKSTKRVPLIQVVDTSFGAGG